MDIESKNNGLNRHDDENDDKADENAIEITGGPDAQEYIEENQTELEKLQKRENEKKKFLEEMANKDQNGEPAQVTK